MEIKGEVLNLCVTSSSDVALTEIVAIPGSSCIRFNIVKKYLRIFSNVNNSVFVLFSTAVSCNFTKFQYTRITDNKMKKQ